MDREFFFVHVNIAGQFSKMDADLASNEKKNTHEKDPNPDEDKPFCKL